MLLGPVQIHFAGTHGLEGALHAEGADVDVSENQGDEQNRDAGVDCLRNLHRGNVGPIERKQQQQPGHGNRGAGTQSQPEDHLLAGVETTGGRMLRFDEAAALFQPVDVDFFGDIVLEPKRHDQKQTDHKRKTDKVMGILAALRQGTERFVPNERQQKQLSKRDVQARQGEHDERHRREPMREALEGAEALHLLAGTTPRNPDLPEQPITQRQHGDHAEDDYRAQPVQGDFMKMIPTPPVRLYEYAGSLVGNIDSTLDAGLLLEQFLFLDGPASGSSTG